jgi:hypothetical protein
VSVVSILAEERLAGAAIWRPRSTVAITTIQGPRRLSSDILTILEKNVASKLPIVVGHALPSSLLYTATHATTKE